MKTDELMNIRNNQINGNLTDVYLGVVEYGIEDFGFDYINYLGSIGFNDEIICDELRKVLRIYTVHYHRNN